MKRALLFAAALGLWLLSCALLRAPVVTVPPPSPWVPAATWTVVPAATPAAGVGSPDPTPTLLPPPTETPIDTATLPPSLPPPPSPSPTAGVGSPDPTPTLLPPAEGYVIEEERAIGPYLVQLWKNAAGDSFPFDKIGTLSAGGRRLAQVESVFELGGETGTDLTGEGHPDVVWRVYTGGAHCCFSTVVYDLGETLAMVLETPLSNCSGSLLDLDGDGVYEFETCDDLFAYAFCCYAGSPAVRVVLQYQAGQGYRPASPRFAWLYEGDIAVHTGLAAGAPAGEMCEWDGTTKCAVLPVVLDYLYTGRPAQAWSEFSRLYGYADAPLFWAEVVRAVARSPLYAPGDAAIAVEGLPAHYMLQLLTPCGGDGAPVGLLLEGQSGCDADVLRRSLDWLEGLLRDIPLLSEGERLALAPEGCTTDCRLDVVRTLDEVRVGSIRLDTTVGFPGQVYRVNGQESAHWRLRGDLSWERVAQ